ncbi:MAG: Gfo/Idh/MocA family oxidoreductase [Armatimonadetes bacterium]|nr:Gfo/Idh/MocA family oxidoreductase [Armatimonadota bacterium]
MSDPRRVGVGLIGYGDYGRFLIESWRRMPEVEIIAIAGTNPERLQRTAHRLAIPRAYVGHESLLADPDVDIVVVASPPFLHARHAVAAARAGKHLFCEKPLATRVADGEAILDAVKAAGVRAVMGYVMRYTPLARRLKRIVDEGLLGELHRVDLANFAADESLPPRHWFWNRRQSGGILVEHGVHFFDLYTWISGSRPCRTTGHRTTRPGTDQEDRVIATVEYEDGALATFYHAFDKPARLERTRARLGFDRGYIHVDGWIPLCMELEAAVDEAQYARLVAICPEARVTVREEYDEERQAMGGGGHCYHVTRMVALRCEPTLDKQAVYADAVRDALGDLIAAIRDLGHAVRAPLEAGLESLRIATSVTRRRARP